MENILGIVACAYLIGMTYWMIISDLISRDPFKGAIEEGREMVGLVKAYHKARNRYLDWDPSWEEFLEERGV